MSGIATQVEQSTRLVAKPSERDLSRTERKALRLRCVFEVCLGWKGGIEVVTYPVETPCAVSATSAALRARALVRRSDSYRLPWSG